jgi:catechol 2,3-dioxygenase-like lactoylglutathione lyase family enzyme
MMIERIDHVELAMPAGGEDAARRFYGTLLGLPERPKPPNLAARGGAWFEDGAIRVHLGVEGDFRPARKAHVAFVVDDVAALRAACRDAGYETTQDEPLAGHDRIYVNDPFGNRLEFLSPAQTTSVSVPLLTS